MSRAELKAQGKACTHDDCPNERKFGDIVCELHAEADRLALHGVLASERAVIVDHIKKRAYAVRQREGLGSEAAAELDVLAIWIVGRTERERR